MRIQQNTIRWNNWRFPLQANDSTSCCNSCVDSFCDIFDAMAQGLSTTTERSTSTEFRFAKSFSIQELLAKPTKKTNGSIGWDLFRSNMSKTIWRGFGALFNNDSKPTMPWKNSTFSCPNAFRQSFSSPTMNCCFCVPSPRRKSITTYCASINSHRGSTRRFFQVFSTPNYSPMSIIRRVPFCEN